MQVLRYGTAFAQSLAARRMGVAAAGRSFSFWAGKPKQEGEPGAEAAAAAPQRQSRHSLLSDLRMLTKFGLSTLNSFVALSGYLCCPGTAFLSLDTALFVLATQLMAMTSQAVNQVIERSHDGSMLRTCMRPIPRNRITPVQASLLSLGFWTLSSSIYWLTFPVAGLLAANAILFSYIMAYTPLKRTSELNTLIGSLVGALPPLLGWLAAGGGLLAVQPWALVVFIFAWQFPHFFGILWTYRSDYDKNDFKMISDPRKAAQIMRASLAAMGLAASALTAAGGFSVFGLASILYFLARPSLAAVNSFEQEQSVSNAKNLKKTAYTPFSLFFLFVFLKIAQLTPEDLWLRFSGSSGEPAKPSPASPGGPVPAVSAA